MANDRAGGDWRNAAGGTPPPARPASASRRSWQPGGPQAPAATGKARSRGFRLLLAAGITGALAGLVILVIWLFWPARYPQLVLVGAVSGDSLALPENAASANAASELTLWASEGHDRDRPKLDANPVVTVDASGAKISIDPNPKNLVVYLAAHGGADANGPYLWMAPADARSANDAHRVRVRDLIERIGEKRSGKPTLLIFDATRVTVSWPHGILFNDFARALKELDQQIDAVPGLAVICASDDDQRSWLFEERRVSVFGYFWLEAMRGAGHDRGQRVTAASAFANAKAEVERWAIGNRGEKQSPILLPATNGQGRAEKIDLAAAPASGYQKPRSIDAPTNIPAELEDAWKKANDLAAQVPPPEANNPAKWREYLDLLVRYDRLFRLGANTNAVRDRIAALATQLQNPSIGREPACLPTAFPTARALGRPAQFADKKTLENFRSTFRAKIWGSASVTERSEAWSALLRAHPGQEALVRTATAALVLAQLLDDGPSAENLANADAVLATTHVAAGLSVPAEMHFARMLHTHLDGKNRPESSLLLRAITLRRDAEEAAWVLSAEPKVYPYSEVVYAWVRAKIEDGDRNRQRGQDLLFGTDVKRWAEADQLFEAARGDYTKARTDGSKVAAALATRDMVFARLPYYARWLAAYRGTRPQTEIDRLLDGAEKAAHGAHDLARMMTKDVPPVDQLEALDRLRAETDGHFKAIADAFDADVASYVNEPNPSNWHAIDSALAVPFIPARRRVELLGFLRHISYQLAAKSEQLGGSQVSPPQTREVAIRTGRMALALLGDTSADRRELVERPNPNAWWTSLRAAGEQIGNQFRDLAQKAKEDEDRSVRAPSLKEGASSLASAALRGRLADPAAPLGAPDPVAANQRFRRHSFLLWQAQRVTSEGWADAVPTPPEGWYCRKVAATLIGSAESLIRENAAELTGRPAENLPPGELDRWLAECRLESQRRPVELALSADPAREVADELAWTFAFKLTAAEKDKGAVGFPVSWFSAPGLPYPQPEPGTIGRRVETDFAQGRLAASRTVRFVAKSPPQDLPGSRKLSSTVLYRGHLYLKQTEVTLVGTPTREVTYTPPQGDGAFAIRADRAAIAGAVTILVDLTSSMTTNHIIEGDETSPRRIEEAKTGLQLVLKQLHPGTTVTLAYFYGTDYRREEPRIIVEPYDKPLVMNGKNWDVVYDKFKDAKADGPTTPLAGAIREVLVSDNAAKFWPAKNATGSRTLIVLTDGEDNWGGWYQGKEQPGEVALKALQNTPDEVNLHIVFFGLTSKKDRDEEKRAKGQFEALTLPANFRAPHVQRTPAQLWTGIRDAAALADLCKRAMLPAFEYSRGQVVSDRLESSVVEEAAVRPTGGLPQGKYEFQNLHGQQAIQLRPADRVMLDARKRDGRFELSLPAYANEMSVKYGLPRRTTGTAATAGIHATIPKLRLKSDSQHAELSFLTTLEPIGERGNANLLEVSRPKFAWFDVRYADGMPAEKGLTPTLRVENKWPLWAPTWKLDVSQWEQAGVDPRTARHPVTTAYWLDGFPVASAHYPINLSDLDGSRERLQKLITVRVRDTEVTLLSISIEEYGGSGLPKENYLTVRMKYGKPGELVFLRPGNLRGTDQPFTLYERHTYYDTQARYTARFGPIDADTNKDITFDLHAVADLKAASEKAARSVTVRLPEGTLKTIEMPQELEVAPRK